MLQFALNFALKSKKMSKAENLVPNMMSKIFFSKEGRGFIVEMISYF
jgi:hypothetical protein